MIWQQICKLQSRTVASIALARKPAAVMPVGLGFPQSH